MELRNIRAFVEVVRQGGFSNAAKRVFATQSTVSKAVKQLEDELGVLLLDRIGHSVKMTQAGEVVFRRGCAMLDHVVEMQSELEELRGMKRGTLRMGFPLLGSNTLFADIFAVFRQKYPHIEIQMVEQGGKRLEEMLLAGELDLAASLLPVDSEELDWQEVRSEPMDLLVANDHPLADEKIVGFSDLKEYPFILYAHGFALNPMILEACKGKGFTPVIAAQSSQIEFIIGLVAAKLGIALLPRMIAAQHPHPKTRLVPVGDPSIFWRMSLMWRKGAYLPPAARAWLELTKAHWG
ncbi:LysR family transcriptional regulator [Seleniivibrio sp.]|uniref:LysR family transcriptional regulator n=1 Tax=Seleniivibrio sp. TaxID=2898801 RepID=UPI0025D6917F|nr:LysR family transcriptional regulator [Seleniivibrio sp.]MCD8552658.1 LysR family transcriptional regulator [Seleniivibrio sp.]